MDDKKYPQMVTIMTLRCRLNIAVVTNCPPCQPEDCNSFPRQLGCQNTWSGDHGEGEDDDGEDVDEDGNDKEEIGSW